jgi:hypothetical protein
LQDYLECLSQIDLSPWIARATSNRPDSCVVIGESREGRPLHVYSFGEGESNVSVIAGCHADEPVGPITARLLSQAITTIAPNLLDACTFHVIPDMNPDGADRNRGWFERFPDIHAYVNGTVREKPGDDIEFGFGEGEGQRPECAAMMACLAPFAPFVAHFSLHGMGFAEGAWFLLCREWLGRLEPIMDTLTCFCADLDVPLHDIDRHGEKGFSRIRAGFCTTPRSEAMRDHFLGLGDPDMAARFRPNSMEHIMSLGGDPVCAVSELPMFQIGLRNDSIERPSATVFREELDALRASGGGAADFDALFDRYRITPMPIELQVRLQLAFILTVIRDRLGTL